MKIYYQMSTKNRSFIDMHKYLEAIGVKNNKFMLTLLDPDLANIDPHDPNLSQYMMGKVLRECMANFWYFIREVVRVPDQGGSGTRLNLHRGNMALFFCLIYNMNILFELPRQQGKTLSAEIFYLWVFNFGTTNSTLAFMNLKLEDSKKNLGQVKELREALPKYLRMDQPFMRKGNDKKTKASNTILTLEHAVNKNKIITISSARSKAAAQNLLRGKSTPLWWADEWAFCPYNSIIYVNSAPAFKRAADIARANGAPHGILFTTTPGFLTSDEGLFAFQMKEDATPFSERWYDLTYKDITEVIDANMKSSFVYIRFTYQQLGCSEKWFKEICITMNNKWEDIRREVLLEWSNSSDNSPFTPEQLEEVDRLTKEPINSIALCGNKFTLNIYEKVRYNSLGRPVDPPIIGVDVSGGYRRDASAICIIDSKSTKVLGDLKCNYISQDDLAKCIFEIVTRYMDNAVINIERNGGFGTAVISMLLKTSIKKNLYYEMKDRVTEEIIGSKSIKTKKKMRVFGLDSSKNMRERLIDILRDRMDNHKDKFISKKLYEEFIGLEVKRNGKVDHSANTHDDLTFAYLMAMYVWYDGLDLKARYNITKEVLKTDEDVDSYVFDVSDEVVDISEEIIDLQKDEENDANSITEMIHQNKQAIGVLFSDFEQKQINEDKAALAAIFRDPVALRAYAYKYNMTSEDIKMIQDEQKQVEDFTPIYNLFYDQEKPYDVIQGNLADAFKNLDD